jgi:integrase
MSSSDELNETPEVRLVAASPSSLPEKSKKRYITQFNLFKHWCETKLITSYSESALISYFKELVDNDRKSLWAVYSMLNWCLRIYENVDISKYSKLLAYLKTNTKYYKPKKSKIFQVEEIAEFLTAACDDQYLLMKAALVIGICCACRRIELYALKLENVIVKDDIILVKLPDTKTKICRSYAITNPNWVEVVKKYRKVRLKLSVSLNNFFLRYENGRCVNSPLGLNTIGAIPSRVAKFLKLEHPMDYTGHNFRNTSANLLANGSGDFFAIKKYGDWNSSALVEGYEEQSLMKKIDVAKIFGVDGPSTSKNYCDAATQTVVASNVSTNDASTISSIDKNRTITGAPAQYIEIQIGNKKIDTSQIIPGLLSNVKHCDITVDVYNNCTFTR